MKISVEQSVYEKVRLLHIEQTHKAPRLICLAGNFFFAQLYFPQQQKFFDNWLPQLALDLTECARHASPLQNKWISVLRHEQKSRIEYSLATQRDSHRQTLFREIFLSDYSLHRRRPDLTTNHLKVANSIDFRCLHARDFDQTELFLTQRINAPSPAPTFLSGLCSLAHFSAASFVCSWLERFFVRLRGVDHAWLMCRKRKSCLCDSNSHFLVIPRRKT